MTTTVCHVNWVQRLRQAALPAPPVPQAAAAGFGATPQSRQELQAQMRMQHEQQRALQQQRIREQEELKAKQQEHQYMFANMMSYVLICLFLRTSVYFTYICLQFFLWFFSIVLIFLVLQEMAARRAEQQRLMAEQKQKEQAVWGARPPWKMDLSQ